jgi:hypothetical protein
MQAIFLDTCSGVRRRSVSGFQTCLADLQDHLGALKDIAVHKKLAPKLVAGKPNAKVRARAFAAGMVSGHEQSEIEPLLKAANKDAQEYFIENRYTGAVHASLENRLQTAL